MMIDVTNSPKDVHDYWYNSEDIMPKQTKHNYNELVDHLVNTMTKPEAPFDTSAYKNYKALVDKEKPPFIPKKVIPTKRKSFDELYKEYSSKSVEDQIENLKELGRQLVSRIDTIVDNLDVILEDISGAENDNVEEEINVDPLTHKVTYNKETNVYNVVKRED